MERAVCRSEPVAVRQAGGTGAASWWRRSACPAVTAVATNVQGHHGPLRPAAVSFTSPARHDHWPRRSWMRRAVVKPSMSSKSARFASAPVAKTRPRTHSALISIHELSARALSYDSPTEPIWCSNSRSHQPKGGSDRRVLSAVARASRCLLHNPLPLAIPSRSKYFFPTRLGYCPIQSRGRQR